MQSAFKFSMFAHPCPFFCYSIRLVRAENAENSVTKYTSVIHDNRELKNHDDDFVDDDRK